MRQEVYRDGQLIETRWLGTLDQHKRQRINEIDARTGELIGEGLEVASGVRISLSIEAQTSYQGIAHLKAMGEKYVPQPISTLDGRTYVIETANDFVRIARLMAARITTVKRAGQQLRLAILAATTHEEIDEIKDTRN